MTRLIYLSSSLIEPHCKKKTCLAGFPTRSDTQQAVQLQMTTRCLKFRILEKEGYYLHATEEEIRCLFDDNSGTILLISS